jgi:putative hydroxymethylpyrimidine transport system permease protein
VTAALGGARTFASRYWGVLGILAIWQVYVSTQNLNSIVVPSPTAVFADVLTEPGAYLPHVWSTTWVAFVGLCVGVTLGIAVAVLSWLSPLLSGIVTPPAMVFRSVPVVAMIPVIARLLGYDIRTVLAITVIISFFPSFVFTLSGLRDLPAGSADVFSVLGSSRLTYLRRLALPSAVPNLLVAIRLSAANCVLAALVAEFLMGTQGLGYLFVRTRSEMDMARSWGAALVATVLSVSAFVLAARLEQWGRERWR